MTGIIAAIAAIPEILKLIKELAIYMQKTYGDDWHSFIVDSSLAFKKVNEAKTEEEKIAAAKELQSIIHRLNR